MAYEMTCKACGHTLRGEDKERLFNDVQQHNQQQHNMPTERSAFEERVRETPARA